MKNLNKIILVAVAFLTMQAFTNAQTLSTINGESGNRSTDQANCWGFGSFTVANYFTINGTYSYKGNAASSDNIGACWIQAPWCKISSGSITLKAKIDGNNGTYRKLIFSYYNYDASKPFGQGTLVRFDSVQYNAGSLPLTTQNISITIPSSIVSNTSVYKIMISAVGSGGSSRWVLDDVNIPATYWSNPSNSCLPLALIVDADSDGVQDSDDAYPTDATRAYNNYCPSTGFGTLMFEDLWPATGDYDFNDLVVGYRYNTVTNAANKVVEVKATYVTRAIGASFHNGFGVQLNGVAPSSIASVTGSKASGASWLDIAGNGTENGQTFANVIVFDDAWKILASPGGSGVNINLANDYVTPDTTQMTISFTNNAVNYSDLNCSKFNPYLIANQERGKEIHLPDYVPTSKASTALFGTMQDNTIVGSNRYYKTSNNLPWALDVVGNIPNTNGTNDFISAYLKFADWAQSNGSLYTDWYSNTGSGYRDVTKLYIR